MAHMKVIDIVDHVKATKVIGTGDTKKVVVVVNDSSVKSFRDAVIAASDIRRTKRWDAVRDIDNAVKNYVRTVAGFHGRRLAGIEVVAATKKDDLVRNSAGHFMKI